MEPHSLLTRTLLSVMPSTTINSSQMDTRTLMSEVNAVYTILRVYLGKMNRLMYVNGLRVEYETA